MEPDIIELRIKETQKQLKELQLEKKKLIDKDIPKSKEEIHLKLQFLKDKILSCCNDRNVFIKIVEINKLNISTILVDTRYRPSIYNNTFYLDTQCNIKNFFKSYKIAKEPINDIISDMINTQLKYDELLKKCKLDYDSNLQSLHLKLNTL